MNPALNPYQQTVVRMVEGHLRQHMPHIPIAFDGRETPAQPLGSISIVVEFPQVPSPTVAPQHRPMYPLLAASDDDDEVTCKINPRRVKEFWNAGERSVDVTRPGYIMGWIEPRITWAGDLDWRVTDEGKRKGLK